MAQRYCLALDLRDDPTAWDEYDRYHLEVWPEILASIREAGIESMQIYRTGNRLFMIMETAASFSFADKGAADAANPVVQKWETLMSTFQQALPWAKPGEKWLLMNKVFDLGK
ncbi:L-rhamnose mutarotase [Flavihumibacter petaseus]|uniref:L-rhamnose mutarotase n=1 Tax=Flavihumibacter petaseus NBRC 106054 TaxID=1220578 RepID=A0A0E9MY74_9BACT|nr:L-rhamnose mutarotase [Flavihumibacter petaseus]GAO42448.1 hypothetical protein FPE01S_01_14630 [Flavihumibacter petaseus NBRC 106054]